MGDQNQGQSSSSVPNQRKRGRPPGSTTTNEQSRESTRARVSNWRRSLNTEQRNVINARRRQSRSLATSSTTIEVQRNETEPPNQPTTTGHNRPAPNSRVGPRNMARNYRSSDNVNVLRLPQPTTCRHCAARLFHKETKNFCCRLGKVILPGIPVPPQLLAIYNDQSTKGRHFRQNIRAYNHVFSFTSMGVTLDETLPAFDQGLYTFRAHGAIYHRIGSLLPAPGNKPRFLQMFIYDTDNETSHRLQENSGLDIEILNEIKHILDTYNPYVQTFRQIAQHEQLQSCQLLIRERPSADRQYILPTASQVAAVLVGVEDFAESTDRDIIVHSTSGYLTTVKEHAGCYDPLQYPLLLPHATFGWDLIFENEQGLRVSCCDYYASLLQIRPRNPSILLRGGRLLQQYVVDNYIKIETQKLRWISLNQNKIRAELYQGLQDCLNVGENDAGNIGRRIVLPSSFIGSPRDMYQRYQDAMSIVQQYGKPDIFLTMTCNPNWIEIKNELYPGQSPHDRPDLLTRIFRAKYENLKEEIFEKGILGKVVAHVHIIEFQKRGLPHVHMLLIFDAEDKLNTPDEYDSLVSAEIPNQIEDPHLYDAVLKHMIHGPCGHYKPNAQCMKNHGCNKGFPKPFAEYTVQGIDSYPVYRRRIDNSRTIRIGRGEGFVVDNRWVVPYNPLLLLKYDCHINVEICSSIKSIKYLYKYVYKGPDQVSFEVRPAPNYDEVSKYVDGRWVCAPEALWKIFKFEMTRMYPSVYRLQIHLPNQHQVYFGSDQTISSVLANDRNSRSMLTAFFSTYDNDQVVEKYLYRDFPKYYRYLTTERKWIPRVSNQKVIGRIYAVNPMEGERFYLRLLLNHVKGPKSFDDLKFVTGVQCTTFKQAAERYGLLEEDNSIRDCLAEARCFRMPISLRRLFATILLYCEPTSILDLWDENFDSMIEDYTLTNASNSAYMRDKLLHDLDDILQQHKKTVTDFGLPSISEDFEGVHNFSSLIEHELSLSISDYDINSVRTFNSDQLSAFNIIGKAIRERQNAMFFLDGPGGTGKTYLYRALLATFRKEGFIILATASSGIAANLLPGGRTAHSKFKIPINFELMSTCKFNKKSDLRDLIKQAGAIIWDEAPMIHRKAFEAVDRSFKDVLDVNEPFGGKIMIFGGDFRQLTPVVVNGTKAQIISSSIVESYLWSNIRILSLTLNMRAHDDPQFSDFLLRVGSGVEPTILNDMIQIPNSMVIPWEDEGSLNILINAIFPNLASQTDVEYMESRAIITPLNEDVNRINEKCLEIFPGECKTYYSFDSVVDDTHNLYLPEFLNSINPGNLPPHELNLKKGSPIMLLRNIDPKIGLCNGTRLTCLSFSRNVIEAKILSGEFKGHIVFLPRIPLKSAEDVKMPFELTRKQFPIRLSYALTINKSQGQTISNVGVYLPNDVFSHGQLYVALSRGVSANSTKVMVKNGIFEEHDGVYTKNVVFKEIFTRLRTSDQNT